MAYRFLRPEDIRRLSSFEFAPKNLAEGFLAGRHRSRRVGASTEFRDLRPYSVGDDIRDLDWRVLARTDRPWLRTFEIETNTDCHILLDSSGSMGFGKSPSKLEYASFFLAALAYLVVRNRDLVSVGLLDEGIRSFFPPGSTQGHLNRILQALEDNRAGQPTRLAESIRRVVPLIRRRGTLILVSDFLDDPAAFFRELNPFLHRGFRVHLLQILHPDELRLRANGLTRFVDLESGSHEIAHAEHLAKDYAETVEQHLNAIRALASRKGIGYRLATTQTPFLELFDDFVR